MRISHVSLLLCLELVRQSPPGGNCASAAEPEDGARLRSPHAAERAADQRRARHPVKVFNFGLPRTGTTSFASYTREMGLRTLHSNQGQITRLFPEELAKFRSGVASRVDALVSEFDAFGDLPWYALAEPLMKRAEPGWVFVATYRRDFAAWVDSLESVVVRILNMRCVMRMCNCVEAATSLPATTRAGARAVAGERARREPGSRSQAATPTRRGRARQPPRDADGYRRACCASRRAESRDGHQD